MNSFYQRKEYNLYLYFLLFILSGFFLYFFSRSTSPLYHNSYLGLDSAFFRTMGIFFIEGKIPYVDYFDHKGPVIIFIEALGAIILPGKDGIFLLQIINLFFILFFIYKISSLFNLSLINLSIVILVFLFLFSFTIDEGNMTEEYSILFSFWALFITLKYFVKSNYFLSKLDIVVLGICFCIPFWIRANNSSVVLSCIVFVFLTMCIQKDWKKAGNFLFILLLTILIFSLGICAYFAYRGAFYEMIDATFIFNFKYASHAGIDKKGLIMYLVFGTGLFLLLFTGIYLLYKQDKNVFILLFGIVIFLVGFIPACMGYFLKHYLTLTLPLFVLGTIFIFNSEIFSRAKLRKLPYIIIVLSFAGIIISFFYKHHIYKAADKLYAQKVVNLLDRIPEEEKDNLFCYSVSPKIYLIGNLSPYYKYYTIQEHHSSFDKEISNKINYKVLTDKPKWIITEKRDFNKDGEAVKFKNEGFNIIVDNHYKLLEKLEDNGNFLSLYRLND